MYFIKSKKDKDSLELTNNVLRFLRGNSLKYILDTDIKLFGNRKSLSEVDPDHVIVIGDDNTLLESFQELRNREISVLGIASKQSFLMQGDSSNYQRLISLLSKNKFSILKRSRIEAVFNKKYAQIALNDIGIFPAKSASLMRYNLSLNSELLWKDTADGVIVSTPTGSTGYSYSAHGPIILDEPYILSINAISSTEKKAPVIISNKTTIEISQIDAQNPVVIVDGDFRIPLKENKITIKRSKFDALFVQFSSEYQIEKKLKKRSSISSVASKNLPPSAKLVYKILSYEGNLTQKEIISATSLPERTVRAAIDILEKKKLITTRPHLTDARQTMYSI